MAERAPPHEKISFARKDIVCLDSYPSAASHRTPAARLKRGLLRIANGRWVAPLTLLLVFVAAGLGATVALGTFGEKLRHQAEMAMSELAGSPLDLKHGGTGLSLVGGGLLAIDIRDVAASRLGGQSLVEAGSVAFSLRPLALLAGRTELGGVTLSDARIDLSDVEMPEAGGQTFDVWDAHGLIDPEQLGAAIFEGVRAGLERLEQGGHDRAELRSVEIRLPGRDWSILISQARLEHLSTGATLNAQLEISGRRIDVELVAGRNEGGLIDLAGTIAMNAAPDEDGDLLDNIVGRVEWTVAASEREPGSGMIEFGGRAEQVVFPPRSNDPGLFDIAFSAELGSGSGKLEITELAIFEGHSAWIFHGAAGIMPEPLRDGGPPAYRFELVSDGSHVAPEGSPEPAIEAVARIAGSYAPSQSRLVADEIGLRTRDGEAHGHAEVSFAEGSSPGIAFHFDVPGISAAHAKQLWPWFAADGARKWAHDNLFAGTVTSGTIWMVVEPGRLGDGRPLQDHEVGGEFSLEGAGFDIVGSLSPVTDGRGSLTFAGPGADIRLETGTLELPSGRTARVSDGTMLVRRTGAERFTGQLEIGLAGEASAIFELASQEPISAQRFVELSADEIEGEVEGRVIADIPIGRDARLDELDWLVMLDYAGLSLGRPFAGHEVSAANGSIMVEQGRAVIDAEARLDGMPARINLVEPFGSAEAGERRRDVSLLVDDGARERLLPGLAAILSGTAAVDLRDAQGGRSHVDVDLQGATVSLPWAGWSKGAGIPARASFAMETASEGRTRLEEFVLSGETFQAAGRIALDSGELASARFDRFGLNRGDDFSLDIARSGRGYAVSIKGRSLDARALVKHLTRQGEVAEAVEGIPVAVDLEIAAITGFHGETLRDVRLSYRGIGARIDSLQFAASTASGAPVRLSHVSENGRRAVAMNSTDAGAVLRFLDIYERMEGGTIELALSGAGDGPLAGHVDARNFAVVGEPRLGSIVSATPEGGNRSLNQAVRTEIDVSRVHFDRGFARLGRGTGWLTVDDGVLRGSLIGTTFRGTLYDGEGNMDLAGTFMPAYGINRLFGQVPVLGMFLGNGRDGGLIGITYRLSGRASSPDLQVNPLSVIAPGIFRQVFEFR